MSRLPIVATILIALAVCAAPPEPPTTPAAVSKLVLAQQFTLAESYKFAWRREKPEVTSGWILVLKVDPELVRPQQTREPVLYVGDQTAERVNVGFKSGHVIAVVPTDLDLSKALIWFGAPDLPEDIDAEKIEKARKAALRAKIQPFSADAIKSAKSEAAKRITARQRDKNEAIPYTDCDELRRSLAPLIRLYAPDEQSLCERLEMIPATPDDT